MNTLNLLLLNDEISTFQSIKNIIENAGHKVKSISTEKLKSYATNSELVDDLGRIDVVLKGNMENIDVVEKLFSKVKTPIILITTNYDDEVLQNVKKIDPSAVLVKPFGNDEMITTIKLVESKIEKERAKQRENNYSPLINQKKIIEELNEQIENIAYEEKLNSIDESIPGIKYVKLNFNELLRKNKILLIIINKDGDIKYSNEAFNNLTGISKYDDRNIFEFIFPNDVYELENSIKFNLSEEKRTQKIKFRILNFRNKYVTLENTIELLKRGGDNKDYYSITALVLDELKYLKKIINKIKYKYGESNHYSLNEIKRINLILKMLNNIFKESPTLSELKNNKNKKNMFTLVEFSDLLMSEIDDMSKDEIITLMKKL